MKLPENSSTAPAARQNETFFSKDAGNGFFNTSPGVDKFFSKSDSANPSIQAKLAIGQPGDQYEQEADQMADHVIQRYEKNTQGDESVRTEEEKEPVDLNDSIQKKDMTGSESDPPDDEGMPIQRKFIGYQRKAEKIQKKDGGSEVVAGNNIESGISNSKGSGSPLPADTGSKMGSAFGKDFSNVRVHTDSTAVQMNSDLQAHAFTYGSDIYFNSGKYDTNSKAGKHLLAHELTHVVQQGGSTVQTKKDPDAESEFQKTDNYQVQGAWYNFSIPFTNYRFDPSIEGVKTAAGLVKDTAVSGANLVKDTIVEAAEWIYNEIVGLVESAKKYILEKIEEVKQFASSAFDKIKNGLAGVVELITSPMGLMKNALTNLDAGLMGSAWSALSNGANAVWRAIKSVTSELLSLGGGIWNRVSGFVTSLFDRIGSLINSRPFSLLPDSLQETVHSIYNKVRSMWESIRYYWNDFWKRITTFVKGLLDSIEAFVKKVVSFAIDVVLKIVKDLKAAYNFVQRLTTDPESVLRPISDQIAGKIESEAPGKAQEVAKEKLNEFLAGNKSSSSTGVIQKQSAGKVERRTATMKEADAALTRNIVEQWNRLSIKTMLWDTLVNMFWPPATIKAIGQEFSDLWHKDWGDAVDSFFWPRSILDDFSGFFHDIWSNILVILEFPWTLWRRINSILMLLMGYLTIVLILAGIVVGAIFGGPPGALAGAIAGAELAWAIGEALFISYLLAESSYILKLYLDLFTARQTKDERERDYISIAGSVIGLGIAIVVAVLFMILGAFVSRVVAFLKSRKAPTVKPPEPPKTDPPKTDQPKTEKPKTDSPTEEQPKTPTEEQPKTEAPKEEQPKTPTEEQPKTPSEEQPKTPTEEQPKTPSEEQPKTPTEEQPKTPTEEQPKTETPKEEPSKTPTEEQPKTEPPKEEQPKIPTEEQPKTEPPIEEQPKIPTEEQPKAPTEEQPKTEPPKEEQPKTPTEEQPKEKQPKTEPPEKVPPKEEPSKKEPKKKRPKEEPPKKPLKDMTIEELVKEGENKGRPGESKEQTKARVDEAKAEAKSRGYCFVEGTPVQTPEGPRPIESLVAGDIVFAKEDGKPVKSYVIAECMNSSTSSLCHLEINNTLSLSTTRNHPFYVPGTGWMKAKDLQSGMSLLSLDDKFVLVTKVSVEKLLTPVKTYNFHVSDGHSYFVGNDLAVWVHNGTPVSNPALNEPIIWGLGSGGPRQRMPAPAKDPTSPNPKLRDPFPGDVDGASGWRTGTQDEVGRFLGARSTEGGSGNHGAITDAQLKSKGLIAVETPGTGAAADAGFKHVSIRPENNPDPNVELTEAEMQSVKTKLEEIKDTVATNKPADFLCE